MNDSTAYVIWYGSWSTPSTFTLVETFLTGLGLHPWWDMTKEYTGAGSFNFGGSIKDNYSQGKSLTMARVLKVVNNAILSNSLPDNPNGIYLVLTSKDVKQEKFCSSYCGWHNYNGSRVYAFIGDPARCPNACTDQTGKSPNDNIGADGMVSVIAHELTEAASDPFLDAWYDANGAENADKCAWTYGTKQTAPNGAFYNMVISNTSYLVQQNWKLSIQDCAMF